jgi:hypothetical protein
VAPEAGLPTVLTLNGARHGALRPGARARLLRTDGGSAVDIAVDNIAVDNIDAANIVVGNITAVNIT